MINPETGQDIKEPELDFHRGLNQPQFFDQIVGLFQTVSSAPSVPPRFIKDQIQIYSNSGTKKIYIWDNTNQVWLSATLT